jgi:hypothetical protein
VKAPGRRPAPISELDHCPRLRHVPGVNLHRTGVASRRAASCTPPCRRAREPGRRCPEVGRIERISSPEEKHRCDSGSPHVPVCLPRSPSRRAPRAAARSAGTVGRVRTLLSTAFGDDGAGEAPGNVLLPARSSGLSRDSVANVSQIRIAACTASGRCACTVSCCRGCTASCCCSWSWMGWVSSARPALAMSIAPSAPTYEVFEFKSLFPLQFEALEPYGSRASSIRPSEAAAALPRPQRRRRVWELESADAVTALPGASGRP